MDIEMRAYQAPSSLPRLGGFGGGMCDSHDESPSSPPKLGGVGGGMASSKRHPRNSQELLGRRKELRNNSTMAEKALWDLLKGKRVAGLKFRRQYSIDNYILDFYCPQLKLAIELDGDYHFHVEQPVTDKRRDDYLLQNYGIKTLRFENHVVFERQHVIVAAIMQCLAAGHTTPNPSYLSRGAEAAGHTTPNPSYLRRGAEAAGHTTPNPSYLRRGAEEAGHTTRKP